MSNQLAVINQSEWSVMVQQADVLVKSGLLPQSVNNAQKAIAIMMLGQELGIGAWAALNGVNVIQGKTTVSPQLMLALINRSGQLKDMEIEETKDACKVTMHRGSRTPYVYMFTMENAKEMGLAGKDNWKKQPGIMMKWRAVAGCARIAFPDIILGMYTPEEMGANVEVDDVGNMTVVENPKDVISIVKEHWAADENKRRLVMDTLKELGFVTKEQIAKALNKVDRKISDNGTEMRLSQTAFETPELLVEALKAAFPKEPIEVVIESIDDLDQVFDSALKE